MRENTPSEGEQVDLTLRLSPQEAVTLRDLLDNPAFRLARLEFRPTSQRLSQQDFKTGTLHVKVSKVDGAQW